MKPKNITLIFSGASGVIYGLRVLECLLDANVKVYLLISKAAQVVLATETTLHVPAQARQQQDFFCDYFKVSSELLQVFGHSQWMAPVASGSNAAEAMVICPCSMATIATIAQGISNDLIGRAADVMLKERRKLIVVPREMPLSVIHLENLLKLARMGIVTMPASPGFYHQPENINELVDFVVARILDHLNVEHHLLSRWGVK